MWPLARLFTADSASPLPAEASSSFLVQRLPELLQNYIRQIHSGLLHNNQLQSLARYLTNKLHRVLHAVITGPSLLIFISALIFMSPWARSLWAGTRPRLSSPFGRRNAPPIVTEDDYSYITSADITPPERIYDPSKKHTSSPNIESKEDVLFLKIKGTNYPTKFPANAIRDNKLKIRDLRERAAAVMGLPERSECNIILLYNDQQLRDDSKSCRDYDLKSYCEIICLMDEASFLSDYSGDGSENQGGAKKKQRKRSKKERKTTSKKNEREYSDNASINSHSASPSTQEIQETFNKLNAISTNFRTKILPLCIQFKNSPPKDAKKRDFEHKKLSETIMNEVLLKLDAVETNGDNGTRGMRKDLVKEVQGILSELDNAACK